MDAHASTKNALSGSSTFPWRKTTAVPQDGPPYLAPKRVFANTILPFIERNARLPRGMTIPDYPTDQP
jgi:hypothetical protein